MATAILSERTETLDDLSSSLPALHSGDRMDQATFLRLYEAMPEGFRAELIGGVVILPPPNVTADHAENQCSASTWVYVYQASTPGTRALSGPTILLGQESQPEPDAALLIRPDFGGQTRVAGKYVSGPPELVVEVSYSTYAHDIHAKKRDYEAAGIGEYVVFILHPPRRIVWFENRDGRFEELQPGDDGIYRSRRFPGLWLDPQAAISGNAASLLKTLQDGLDSPEHEAFVEQLKASHRPDSAVEANPTIETTEFPES